MMLSQNFENAQSQHINIELSDQTHHDHDSCEHDHASHGSKHNHTHGNQDHQACEHQACQHQSNPTGKRLFYPIQLLHTLVSYLGPCSMMHYVFIPHYDGFFKTYLQIVTLIVAVMGTVCFHRITKQFQPRFKNLLVHKQCGPQLKVCEKCPNQPLKHARVSHCSQCTRCIYMLDHHCSFTQTCIMYTNIKSFFLFVVYLLFGSLHYIYLSYNHIGRFELVKEGYFVLIVWLLLSINLLFLVPMVAGLVVLHSGLILNNMTTLETMKNKSSAPWPFVEYRPELLAKVNPYDRGEIRNCIDFLQGHLVYSLFPTARKMRNDFLPERINPKPSLDNIYRWYPEKRKQEEKVDRNLRSMLDDADKLFSNKTIKLGSSRVSIN